jgi:hypothetical protein
MRVFACYVVSKLQRHRCPTFRALRSYLLVKHVFTYKYIIYIYMKVTSKHARIRLLRCVQIATPSVLYFPSFAKLLTRKTCFYIFLHINIYSIYMKVTSKHARIRLLRCVQIAMPSVPYFPRFAIFNKRPTNGVTLLYI